MHGIHFTDPAALRAELATLGLVGPVTDLTRPAATLRTK